MFEAGLFSGFIIGFIIGLLSNERKNRNECPKGKFCDRYYKSK